jgi:hypothetical protein
MSGYDLPDPPSPEEHEEQAPPQAEEIARQASDEQILAGLQYPGRVKTAFLVWLSEEGMWLANSNLDGMELEQLPNGATNIKKMGKIPPFDAIEIERPATLQEIGHACQVVGFDVQNMLVANMTSGQTMMAIEAKTQQVQAQMQGAAIMERIKQAGGPLGPNGKPFGT